MLHKGDRSYYPTPSKEKGCVSGGILRKEEGAYTHQPAQVLLLSMLVYLPTYLLNLHTT